MNPRCKCGGRYIGEPSVDGIKPFKCDSCGQRQTQRLRVPNKKRTPRNGVEEEMATAVCRAYHYFLSPDSYSASERAFVFTTLRNVKERWPDMIRDRGRLV